MNPSELSQLKQMTQGEIARKYARLLIKKEINQKQYEWLIAQGIGPVETTRYHIAYEAVRNKLDEDFYQDCVSFIESPVSPLNASRSVKTNESVDTAGQFTTHEDQALGKSQKSRLLILLKDKCAHTTPEIMEKVYGSDHLGRSNIPARILDLKNEGHEIECKHESGTIYSYRLIK
jgi:hypothetical protein